MAEIDKGFRKLCSEIHVNGREYENKKRQVKRLQIPSYTFRHDLSKGFPAITNKKLPFKYIKGELIWFLRGDTDVTYLNENGIDIWNKDAYNWYLKTMRKSKEADAMTLEEFSAIGKGSVGQNYSVQWRSFNGDTDQIQLLIKDMKKDIMGSRLKVNAWNPSELDLTALPPCHDGFQIIGVPLTLEERQVLYLTKYEGHGFPSHKEEYLDKNDIPKFGFELHWNQRSVDTFLGFPFNVASYALLAKILEEITGYPALAVEGTLKCVHFYDNQYEAVEEIMKRDVDGHANCELEIDPGFKGLCKLFNLGDINIDELFNLTDIKMFKLKGYTSDEALNVEMLAPIEI